MSRVVFIGTLINLGALNRETRETFGITFSITGIGIIAVSGRITLNRFKEIAGFSCEIEDGAIRFGKENGIFADFIGFDVGILGNWKRFEGEFR
jgi:hypothetical protein